MFVTFGDYGFYFLHRSSWNESGREREREKKGYMSYDNFEHSCNGGDGRATLSRGYSYSKSERLELRNEEERNGGRERTRPWPGRKVIQMKLEAYEKCVFFVPKCTSTGHIFWRTIRVRQSKHEREGDGKATWKWIETTSFILVLQFSIITIILTLKFDLLFWPIVRLYLRHFVLMETRIILYLECKFLFLWFFEMMLRPQQLSMS